MRIIILFIFTVLLIGCASPQSEKTVEVPFSEDVEDYTPLIWDILKSNPKGNIKIKFGDGSYKFYPEKAYEKYLAISNNDNGLKRIVFPIQNMKNVTIEGTENTSFMFHGKLVPFFLYESENISIENIKIDYDYPFVLEGTVIANDKEKMSFDLKIDNDTPYKIEDNKLFFKGYDWEIGLGENIVFDCETRSPIYFTSKYEIGNSHEVTAHEVAEGVVRLSGVASVDVPPVGAIYTDKGPHGKNREVPGFAIQESANINLTNVTVFRAGAMALIAEKSENITLDSYKVKVHDGSGKMLSASADATHFVNCSGLVKLNNCIFESMLDDATNIHGTYMCVTEHLGENKVALSFGHFQQEGFSLGKPGDSILFLNRANLMPLSKSVIKKLEQIDENHYVLEVDQDLTAYQNLSVAVDNISYYPDVEISNCSVRYNRARSLLISTSGRVNIENNYFASMMAGIRICGDANYWFESGRISDVTIKNNTFEDLGKGGHNPQAILQIDPVIPKDNRADGIFHGKVIFENNVIKTFDNQVIYALSVDSLIIKGNQFIDSKTHSAIFPSLSVIDAQYCNHIIIDNNDFSKWKPDFSFSITECKNVVGNDVEKIEIQNNTNKYFYEN